MLARRAEGIPHELHHALLKAPAARNPLGDPPLKENGAHREQLSATLDVLVGLVLEQSSVKKGDEAMPTCNDLGKKHRWRERVEWFSADSTQSVGTYWYCTEYRMRSEERPADLESWRRP